MEPVGVVLPLAGWTVAVRVTGEPCEMLVADATSAVEVLVTPELGVTVRLNVTLWTRSPLMAQRVTGTVWEPEEDDEVSVSVEVPLTRLGTLKEAVTPAGRPDTLRFTAAKLNEFTCTAAVARPEDMV